MGQTYPETEGFALSFSRAELTLKGRVYTAITAVNASQPTEEEAIMGTSPGPLGRTEGSMNLGEGTITFSDERERMDFIDELGDGYRKQLWGLSWVLSDSEGGNQKKIECAGCRVLDAEIAHEQGAAPLGGDITFSFMSHKINGKSPH